MFRLGEVAQAFTDLSVKTVFSFASSNRDRFPKVAYGQYDGELSDIIEEFKSKGYTPIGQQATATATEPTTSAVDAMLMSDYNRLLIENKRLADQREVLSDIIASTAKQMQTPTICREAGVSKEGSAFPYLAILQMSDWHDEPEYLAYYQERAEKVIRDVAGELVGIVCSFGGD